ncbi:hypothetical protein PHYBLDRAFT_60970 [Phycomyces blakesleeanus NRRL 1555(-)]|uniref:F-box domain-containing protein n=1 Tax=Phycomyces blakesleeanus (strain ATCC 8743b / DSM 1359 / FGSC 10004 / NBRC 33097 / NRRL 1555) TaxID=763407 RepID=A0A163B1Y3_PHYB8|nr:hypothetical protein PHYBLDRAFT_60970 [Phycomyces blakesleeanus NRRL 1555(-)]OAD77841.1 hypothetical protein PHYBLDRAFT_60970 [Phycomyces blakesleeanus NRRL 1555(-)]|eukprot:XP_018295881.1 hypothetical protein PHYBLDRAFT_60970 [Phycomyces blakesleeanus NRRL 1555(-)]
MYFFSYNHSTPPDSERLTKLPVELLENILQRLSSKDLCELNHTNQLIGQIALVTLYRSPVIKTIEQLEALSTVSPSKLQIVSELNLEHVGFSIKDFHLQELNQCNRLRILNLTNCKASSSAINQILLPSLKYLQTVILNNCALELTTLQLLGQAGQHTLLDLDLSSVVLKPCRNFDETNDLDALVNLPLPSTLVTINLSYCRWVRSSTLENIARNCPRIRYLGLRWCGMIHFTTLRLAIMLLPNLRTMDTMHMSAITHHDTAERLIKEIINLYK